MQSLSAWWMLAGAAALLSVWYGYGVQNVEDVDELHDLDKISGGTCKGDPPPE